MNVVLRKNYEKSFTEARTLDASPKNDYNMMDNRVTVLLIDLN